jgi:endoglucanase
MVLSSPRPSSTRRTVLLPIVAALAAACSGSGSAPQLPPGSDYVPDVFIPAASLGALHVDGNRIADGGGATVVLRGIALADPDVVAENGHWNAEHFQKAREWGAQVVRIPIHPKYWRARGPAGYLALLDQGVTWAEQQGMYVIIDWHSIGDPVAQLYDGNWDAIYPTSQAETSSFWRIIAAHYKNDPAVAFYEIYNETTTWVGGASTGSTWASWKALAEGLIDVTRAQGASAICIVGGYDWSYDLSPIGADPVDRDGVAYSVHPYPGKRGEIAETAWQSDFGYLVATHPVFATEFGFESTAGTVATGTAAGYGTHITEFFASKGISWTVWVFHPTWTPSLISDWSYTPAVPEGVFFKALLQGV